MNYAGRVLSSGELFINSQNESGSGGPLKVVAGRDSVMREQGLHAVVGTMKVGEICHVWVAPEYGYGEKGNFSFPSVPPNAHLTYAVELMDFEPPVDDSETRHGSLTYEERLEASQRRRLAGNQLYKEMKYDKALNKYITALSFVDDDFLMQLHGFFYDRAMQEKIPSLLNLSACHLKMSQPRDAIIIATQAIACDPKNSKAYFRRGVARAELGQTEDALKDLERAKDHAPSDPAIAREIAKLRRDMREQSKSQAFLYKSMVTKTVEHPEGLYEEEEVEDFDFPEPNSSVIRPWWVRAGQALCPWMFRSGPDTSPITYEKLHAM